MPNYGDVSEHRCIPIDWSGSGELWASELWRAVVSQLGFVHDSAAQRRYLACGQ